MLPSAQQAPLCVCAEIALELFSLCLVSLAPLTTVYCSLWYLCTSVTVLPIVKMKIRKISISLCIRKHPSSSLCYSFCFNNLSRTAFIGEELFNGIWNGRLWSDSTLSIPLTDISFSEGIYLILSESWKMTQLKTENKRSL